MSPTKIIIFLLFVTLMIISAGESGRIFTSTSPLYVSDNTLSGPGTSWWPSNDLAAAIRHVKLGTNQKIHLDGTHYGKFDLMRDLSIYSTTGAQVVGVFETHAKADFEGFEITGFGDGVYIKSGSHVSLKNMTLTGNSEDGIDTEENVTLTIKNSTLTGNRKGLYLRRNSQAEIQDVTVTENRQEGLDIRAASTFTLSENRIEKNTESGIEIIIGDSVGLLKNNTIKDNEKSGITVEYSRFDPELGEIVIANNTIENNTSYGIRCVSRTGGTRVFRYFARSVQEQDNTVSNNDAPHAKLCKFGSVPFEGITGKQRDS